MKLLSKLKIYIEDRILFYCRFVRNPRIILSCVLKRVNRRIALRMLIEKKPYSLDKARKYWKYAPSSIGRVKTSSKKLIHLSDVDIKRLVEKSIQRRNTLQGANIYRNNVSSWIKREKIKNLLDFGCGLGQDGVYFARNLGINVTFADIVMSNIKLVSRYPKIWGIETNGIYINCDPKEFQFPEVYDAIFSNGVLHHTPEAKGIILNLKKFLKLHGLFICMLYTRKQFKETEARTLQEFAIFSESVAPIVNPYSDFYNVEKAKGIFEGFELLETFQTYKGRFGWFVFRRK